MEWKKITYIKYNFSLINPSTQNLYQKRLDEKLQEDESFENTYSNIIKSIHEAAKEAIGEVKRYDINKIWWNEEIEDLVKEKKKLYLKWLSAKSEEDRENYKRKKR